MRKVSREVAKAFLARTPRTIKNTSSSGDALRLHNNVIAWWFDDDTIKVSPCGFGTTTTRERLNALLQLLGVRGGFHQHRHEQYFGSYKISTYDVIPIQVQGGRALFATPDEIMTAHLMTTPDDALARSLSDIDYAAERRALARFGQSMSDYLTK